MARLLTMRHILERIADILSSTFFFLVVSTIIILSIVFILEKVELVKGYYLFYEPRAYKEGKAQGRIDAEREISIDSISIYTVAFPLFYDMLDLETGLTYKSVSSGDIYWDKSEIDHEHGRVMGHNEIIFKHIKENSLPSYSRKKWEHELSNLDAYYESCEQAQLTKRLYADSSRQCLENTGYCIWIEDKPESYNGDYCYLVVSDGADNKRDLLDIQHISEGYLEFAWGPVGSDMVIYSASDTLKYVAGSSILNSWIAIDLRSGCRLLWQTKNEEAYQKPCFDRGHVIHESREALIQRYEGSLKEAILETRRSADSLCAYYYSKGIDIEALDFRVLYNEIASLYDFKGPASVNSAAGMLENILGNRIRFWYEEDETGFPLSNLYLDYMESEEIITIEIRESYEKGLESYLYNLNNSDITFEYKVYLAE